MDSEVQPMPGQEMPAGEELRMREDDREEILEENGRVRTNARKAGNSVFVAVVIANIVAVGGAILSNDLVSRPIRFARGVDEKLFCGWEERWYNSTRVQSSQVVTYSRYKYADACGGFQVLCLSAAHGSQFLGFLVTAGVASIALVSTSCMRCGYEEKEEQERLSDPRDGQQMADAAVDEPNQLDVRNFTKKCPKCPKYPRPYFRLCCLVLSWSFNLAGFIVFEKAMNDCSSILPSGIESRLGTAAFVSGGPPVWGWGLTFLFIMLFVSVLIPVALIYLAFVREANGNEGWIVCVDGCCPCEWCPECHMCCGAMLEKCCPCCMAR